MLAASSYVFRAGADSWMPSQILTTTKDGASANDLATKLVLTYSHETFLSSAASADIPTPFEPSFDDNRIYCFCHAVARAVADYLTVYKAPLDNPASTEDGESEGAVPPPPLLLVNNIVFAGEEEDEEGQEIRRLKVRLVLLEQQATATDVG